MTAENASIVWGEVVMDELVRAGVRHVVITPGSRSTPLVVAAARHPDIIDHSLIDERSAAFFAVGIGLATGRPAALVCTSGTAVANYLPAVAEADLADVPLVMLTADRPPNLSDAGASQAMGQIGIFGDKVRWSCDLGLPAADAELLAHARGRAARAAHVAATERGPVHLNLPFRKPLEQTEVADSHRDAVPHALRGAEVVTGRPDGAPWTSWSAPTASSALPHEIAALCRDAERPIIVVGAPASFGFWERDRLADLVDRLTASWGAPVVAEAMSGLRTRATSDLVFGGDLVTADPSFTDQHVPDLVIQIGRWPINWPVIRWLESLAAPRVVIGKSPADPGHAASHVYAGAPWALEHLVGSIDAVAPEWGRAWADHAAALRRRFESDAAKRPDLDGHVARTITRDAANLFVSSSMPLREVETWVSNDDANADLFANRGLNGIDGVISTAAGLSVGLDEPVDLLIGDVAFVHDVGGLVTARRAGADLRIRVVDNGGGRIFDHLPIARHDAGLLEKHFTTAPGLDLAQIATAFGYSAESCTVAEFTGSPSDAEVVVITASPAGQGARRDLLDSVTSVTAEPPVPSVQDATDVDHDGSEPPLVLLHGFTGDATTWDAFRDAYDGPTIALDLVGHGGRPAPDRFDDATLFAFAEDVLDQLDGAGVDHFDLFGYSMGGRVAMALTTLAPDRVRTLVTLGANPGIEDPHERRQRRDDDWALADTIEREGLDSFIESWLELPIFASLKTLGPEWHEASIAQRKRGSARSYAQALRGAGTGCQPPLWDALAATSTPHLALAGELDEKYARIGQQLATRIATTRAATIPEAGHSAHYERPDEVAEEVARFVRNHAGSHPERNAS